jgi:hypothetical protein
VPGQQPGFGQTTLLAEPSDGYGQPEKRSVGPTFAGRFKLLTMIVTVLHTLCGRVFSVSEEKAFQMQVPDGVPECYWVET